MERSKDTTPAQSAIDHIATIQTQEELAAYMEGEERVTVLKAADQRYAELTAPDDQIDEESVATEEVPESEDEGDSEIPSADTEEEVEEVILVGADHFSGIAQIINNKVEQESVRFTNGKLPEGDVTFTLKETFEELLQASKAEESDVEVAEALVIKFLEALANQVTVDHGRRGLTQAGKIDQELIDLHKELTEALEPEGKSGE